MSDVRLDHPRLIGPKGQMPLVYGEVHAERIRAHAKHGANGNSREDASWTDREWLPILTEELGEAAHWLTYDAGLMPKTHLREELVQVAAMACAWIAAIDASDAEFDALVAP